MISNWTWYVDKPCISIFSFIWCTTDCLIYIPGPVTDHFKPIIFDLQDDLEPTFTKGNVAGAADDVYVGVSTGNFDLLRKESGDWETTVKLKNTSFNLAVDDNAENPAVVNFLGVITPQTEGQ